MIVYRCVICGEGAHGITYDDVDHWRAMWVTYHPCEHRAMVGLGRGLR